MNTFVVLGIASVILFIILYIMVKLIRRDLKKHNNFHAEEKKSRFAGGLIK